MPCQKNRINSFLKWRFNNYIFGLNARYIDSYVNNITIPQASIDRGYSNKVDSSLMFDLSCRFASIRDIYHKYNRWRL